VLGNLIETAPETWGDEGTVKGAMYDEWSDVFSFIIILWRLFGAPPKTPPASPSTPLSLSSILFALGDDNVDPYGHLRDSRGNPLNKWTLRNKIREVKYPSTISHYTTSFLLS
jgi:hypothetical protein